MKPKIIVALITGGFTVLAAVISGFFHFKSEKQKEKRR